MNTQQPSKGHQRPAAAADLDRTEHKTDTTYDDKDNDAKEEEEVPRMISCPLDENGSLLKTSVYYGGTANAPSDAVKSGDVEVPLQSPATSRNRSDSILSMFNTRRRSINDTVILAPDDLSLPPDTPLLGSSKLAANAILQAESANGMSTRPSSNTLGTLGSVRTARTLKEIQEQYLEKAHTSFYNDAITFAEGTIPQSIVIATVIGCVCGVVSYMYYYVLDYFLDLVWNKMPTWIVLDKWPEHLHVLWIPLVTFTLSICCGLSVYYLGEPGDLAYTIQCIHEKGYKGTHHIIPMIAASQFTIIAGASLGPEAPLVAICAATAGFLSRKVFKQTNRNVVRKHTFMGMSGALSAFFGVPLGGSIFALEVASRFGIEYFEHLTEAIFAGEICVVVFRTCAGLPLGQIWKISSTPISQTEPYMILLGGGIGLLGAGVAFLWANFHWRLMDFFRGLGLLDDENTYAVPRILLGACGVVVISMLVPQTMFWGEWEVGAIATLSPASELPHVWPTAGLIGFEMDSCRNCIIVGVCKLLVISFTVAGGYRGGYIFPFFAAGAAFGRALTFAFPELSPVIATLCFAAGINVAITRTALATTLILAFLAGEQFALPAVLAASVVSLFATGYVPFIKSQLARSDIDFSLYYRKNRQPKVHGSVPTAV
eukprot:CAMPEP_0202007994 /NCGR_PEP_ID=MMETSP0905-20130828/12313_1 /ASSEMBLY_ACC=CAM_ASM_000554 /TAXON_ID=420261 /ORGANISM="Thalassiosira antarctica, Strain CCMP982" /LENGTH=656 /DNA_ID=CAMNT_0048566039 /DNA_START=93 /DNA_END=2063 /DNA_ORIENTATION=+